MRTSVAAIFLALTLATFVRAQPAIIEIGVPIKAVNWVNLHPGTNAQGGPSLLATMGQNNGGLFVLDIDLATGKCRQFLVGRTGADYPTATMRSLRTGLLYVGSANTGHLHRYDPEHPERGLEDLGAIDPRNATFPTGIQEAPDGSIWIGAYPTACLTRFNPADGTFTRYGRMDSTEQYLYPLCGDDGTIAGLLKVIHSSVVVFDATTGERRIVGPVLETPTDRTRRHVPFKGTDGLLYLESDQGNFRIQGMEATPVTTLPGQMKGVRAAYRSGYQRMVTLPGGLSANFVDAEAATFRTLRISSEDPAVPSRDLTLDWVGGGTRIFILHQGPDQRVYGSSFLPEHLFRCDADGSNLVAFGQCSQSQGEAYSMVNYGDGLMAIASYPAARISLYDPRLPYRFGLGPGSNPLDIGSLDEDHVAYRPRAMATSPNGRIWVASVANYGLREGTLAWYNPKNTARATHRAISPGNSPFSLLWLPGPKNLLVGFGTELGTGVKRATASGAFALWDTETDRSVYVGDFGIEELGDVSALAPAGSTGLVYALSSRRGLTAKEKGYRVPVLELLLIDPAARALVQREAILPESGRLPSSGEALRIDGSGAVNVVLDSGVYRVKPGTCQLELRWKIPAERISVPGPILGQRLFFATDWKLRAVDLP